MNLTEFLDKRCQASNSCFGARHLNGFPLKCIAARELVMNGVQSINKNCSKGILMILSS